MKKRIISALLCFAMAMPSLFSLSGCGAKMEAKDLMSGIKAAPLNMNTDISGVGASLMADFAVNLFRQSFEGGENTLISPVSVICALAMTANGAAEETLSQMEEAFGLPLDSLNLYLNAYLNALPSDDKYKLSMANSIWIRDSETLDVSPNFLQTNADFYGAGIYKALFDDSTLKDINGWVDKNTDGMIKDILKEIPASTIMYLINALAFDAEWENIYKQHQIQDHTFTTEDGSEREIELMHSNEDMYLHDGEAEGFIKYYADRRYAFAAILPGEGVSVSEYAASLSGDRLMDILSSASSELVIAALPKFEAEYQVEMSEALKALGMEDAFDQERADFSNLGSSSDGNIFIGQVLHKTFISVNEKGTRAGASTVVGMNKTSAPMGKTVILDRPFVYMLIDCQTNLPLFIGAFMSP